MPVLNYRDPVDGTFKPLSAGQTIIPAGDFNTCTATGLYSIMGNATNGLPNAGGAFIGILQVFSIDATHITQIWMGGNNNANPELWTRGCNNGTWTSWENILGRMGALANFNNAAVNGYYTLAGTATNGPGVSGNGFLAVWGSPTGLGGTQQNAIQTWISYTTGEVWQRQSTTGIGGTPSAWVRKDSRITCTSATRPALPAQGQMVYETDTFRSLTYQTATTGWTWPWDMPWGRLAHVENSVGMGNVAVETLVTSMPITLTALANRRWYIEAGFRGCNSTAANIAAFVRIKEGATQLQEYQSAMNAVNAGNGGYLRTSVVPSAGSHTYTMTLTPSANSVSMQAGATFPIWMSVYDVGPNANPA